jgi:hypothetical protein
MSTKPWRVDLHDDFVEEFHSLDPEVQDELLAHIALLEQFGPQLGRPRVDTLNESKHANMKELRFDAADGVWRVAFAFDPNRQAIILCGGDKSGMRTAMRFYKRLIDKADARFSAHLASIKSGYDATSNASDQSRAHSKGTVSVSPQKDRRPRRRSDR